MSRGIFITLEGGEGSGKSTQSILIGDRLENRGREVLLTREPGGTSGAEEIRNLLVSGNPESWSSLSEALLMSAARDDHLRRLIIPALRAEKFVICDRFMDSTWAYQGVAGGVSAELLAMLETHVVQNHTPDLTLVFDLDPEVGLARARDRGHHTENRFEAKGMVYHQNIRRAFLEIAQRFPERCVVVDASLELEDIAAQVWQIVSDRFL